MLISRVNITLPTELIYELRNTVPERKRSSFIAAAVYEKIKAIKRNKAFGELIGSWKKAGGVKFSKDEELSLWRKKIWAGFEEKLSKK